MARFRAGLSIVAVGWQFVCLFVCLFVCCWGFWKDQTAAMVRMVHVVVGCLLCRRAKEILFLVVSRMAPIPVSYKVNIFC